MGDAPELHPLVRAAAEGRLPKWRDADRRRRRHMGRVAELMDRWAKARGLRKRERARWRAAAWLHDAQRDTSPRKLRKELGRAAKKVPAGALHGYATAARMEAAGVDDVELMDAVRHHTLGSADLGLLGRALRAADFLEPGRRDRDGRRAELRELALKDLEAASEAVERIRGGVGAEGTDA